MTPVPTNGCFSDFTVTGVHSVAAPPTQSVYRLSDGGAGGQAVTTALW